MKSIITNRVDTKAVCNNMFIESICMNINSISGYNYYVKYTLYNTMVGDHKTL